MFGIEPDWDNIEFVYCQFEPAGPTWSPGCLGIFRWGAKNIGFGEVTMYQGDVHHEAGVEFDTEELDHSFLKQMMAYWASRSLIRGWDEVSPDESTKDETP